MRWGIPLVRIGVWALVVAVGLAVLVFVPGPVLTAMHKRDAGALADRVDDRRAEVIERTGTAREVLAPLGEPVHSWSAVNCRLVPTLSNGDGPTVTMSYGQSCSPVVREIYALPAEHGSLEQAAALLDGRLGHWDPDCRETIFDVVELRLGQIDDEGYSMDLMWVEPGAEPPPGKEHLCDLPAPDDPSTTRVESSVAEPLTARTYVVLTVAGKAERTSVGCERRLVWVGSCTGTPKDAPYL